MIKDVMKRRNQMDTKTGHPYNVYITQKMRKELKTIASERGVDCSVIVREAIKKELKNYRYLLKNYIEKP